MRSAWMLIGIVLFFLFRSSRNGSSHLPSSPLGLVSASDDSVLVKEGACEHCIFSFSFFKKASTHVSQLRLTRARGAIWMDWCFGEALGYAPRRSVADIFFLISLSLALSRPLFPENEELHFVAGQVGELCLGFVNTLERFINFTHVDASLRSLNDESEVIQNMTRHIYGINTPGKGASVAIDYKFTPDAMLDATTYVFIVEVQYRDGEHNHTEVVFNKTITISEPDEKLFNGETFFLALVFIGGLGFSGYMANNYWQKKSKKGGRAYALLKAESKEVKNSFLTGTSASTTAKKSTKSKKK